MIKFEVKGVVPAERPPNVFVIEVEYMHGDADAYSSNEFTFPKSEEQDACSYVAALLYMVSDEYTHLYDQRKERDSLRSYCIHDLKLTQKQAEDIYGDLVTRDTTDGSYSTNAAIEDFKVFWYDQNGTKHYVEVQEA